MILYVQVYGWQHWEGTASVNLLMAETEVVYYGIVGCGELVNFACYVKLRGELSEAYRMLLSYLSPGKMVFQGSLRGFESLNHGRSALNHLLTDPLSDLDTISRT